MITRSHLARMFPRARADVLDAVALQLPKIERFGVLQSPTRAAYFFAQIGHETAGMTVFEENLSYSAKRLMQVWPKRFPTLEVANRYANNPKALAEKVYGGRMGNGPEGSGDGWRFRGQGALQTTGREAFAAVGRIVGLDLESNPGLATDPRTLLIVAAGVWSWKKGNWFADRDELLGDDDDDGDDFRPLSKAINGGTNGIADREEWLDRIDNIVGEAYAGGIPVTVVGDQIAGTPPFPHQRPQDRREVPAGVLDRAGVETPPPANHGQISGVPRAMVEAVQNGLYSLGYYEVGSADGRFGPRTRAAILAFQADNGLTLDPSISPELLAAIEDGEPREVSPERATGKPRGSRIVAASEGSAAVGLLGSVAGATQVAGPYLDQVEQLQGYVVRIRAVLDPFQAMLSAYWPFLLLGGGAAVVYFALQARRARIQDHRMGYSP